jgi:metallophosphoesterase superfamily enzyme
VEKFDLLVGDHAQLFEQFRATGERVKITLIPGNHDYELAC